MEGDGPKSGGRRIVHNDDKRLRKHGRRAVMDSPPTTTCRIAADRLRLAIQRSGWTYAQAAEAVRRHLPEDTKLSPVSIWSYATGRAAPRRASYIEAIEAAFRVPPGGLAGPNRSGREHSANSPTFHTTQASRPSFSDEVNMATPASTLILADTSDGKVRIKIDATVSWDVGLKIVDILKPSAAADQITGNAVAEDPARHVADDLVDIAAEGTGAEGTGAATSRKY